ncbi:MAG: hypothetical protein ACI9LE_002236, partial [Paraglaciecola sp.]
AERLAPQQALMTSQSKETHNKIQQNTLAVQNSEPNEIMNKHLQEWQSTKPDIARLAALESEVKELIKQLKNTNDRIAYQNTLIMQTSAVTDRDAAKQQKPSKNSKNMYAIQLFSLTEKKIMRLTWDKLSTKHPIILGQLSPIYEEVNMQGKTFYRVKAGSFETKSAAMKLCRSLKNANTDCFLAKFTGIAML